MKKITTVNVERLSTGIPYISKVPVLNTIYRGLLKKVFNVRPHSRNFKGIEVSATQWGNHVRKLFCGENMEEKQ